MPVGVPNGKGKGNEGWAPTVKFDARGRHWGKARRIQLFDYASAGSFDPKKNRFQARIPVAGSARG
jgi:hypothetical protein